MKKLPPATFLQRVDAFCARLNTGLAAVALVLALLTTAALLERLPTMLPPSQPAPDDFSFGGR
jgi:hypothetical protein